MLLAQSSPVGARAMSFRVASMAGDDRESTISIAIHASSRFRPVRSIPIAEKVGAWTNFEAGLPAFGSQSVGKEPGPLQGGGNGSLWLALMVQSVAPLTRPHRSSPGAVWSAALRQSP